MANIKSPTFLKLDSLINHLTHFRREFMGHRIPKFEQQYLMRKEEQMQKEHDARRKEEMLRLRQIQYNIEGKDFTLSGTEMKFARGSSLQRANGICDLHQ